MINSYKYKTGLAQMQAKNKKICETVTKDASLITRNAGKKKPLFEKSVFSSPRPNFFHKNFSVI